MKQLGTHADEMLARLLSGEGHTDESLTNQFRDELYKGFHIESIRKLIESDNPRARESGVWLLSELAEKAASLSDVALRLASSTDAWWRHVFVGFCMNTQVADREILVALAKLLDDPDLRVRSQVIKWIAVVPEGLVEALWGVAFPLQGFSPRVLLGHQSKTMWRDRSHRAFRIGIEIKAGHKVEDIEDQALYEDNYTFDWLLAGNMKIRPITFSS